MNAITFRLSAMMFLQFFVWGAWFATAGKCLEDNGYSKAFTGDVYGTAPLASIFAPLFLGLIADRFFPSQIVMGLLMLIGGVLMCLVPGYAEANNTTMLWALLMGHMVCYMPTLGLSNGIAFTNVSDQSHFPKIRVWGTIGWIVAGLVVGFLGWSANFNIFWVAGIGSITLGIYSFTLPNTPPPAREKPLDIRTLLMVDGFRLLSDIPFLVFIACSTLICIPLAYYYGVTSNYLGNVGFEVPASTMILGQVSEIFFMLLIPFFFRHLGVKWMIVIGMAAWVLRYLLFSFGAPDQVTSMILLAVLLHGICYDFFFVTGFMYADRKAPPEVRGQVQSMLVFFTQGVGMYIGYKVAFNRFGSTVPDSTDLSDAFTANSSGEELSYLESLGRMFSSSIPEGIDSEFLQTTMEQWREFWFLPAIMAGVILIAFALLFHDKEGGAPPTDEETTE